MISTFLGYRIYPLLYYNSVITMLSNKKKYVYFRIVYSDLIENICFSLICIYEYIIYIVLLFRGTLSLIFLINRWRH